VYREALERCAKILEPFQERPLLSVIFAKEGEEGLVDETRYTQPALFAGGVGVERDVAFVGSGAGGGDRAQHWEYVAAVRAGVMRLEDGLKLIAARGRLMQGCREMGDGVDRGRRGPSGQGGGAVCAGGVDRGGERAGAGGDFREA